jgi:flagellar hook-length control protein FliK
VATAQQENSPKEGGQDSRGSGSGSGTQTAPALEKLTKTPTSTPGAEHTNPAFTVSESHATTEAQQSREVNQAAHILRNLQVELQKAKQSSPNRMELQIPTQDGGSVQVRLEMRAGEMRTIIRTDNPELREALAQAWPDFSQRSQDRGIKLGEAAFENSWQRQGQNPGQDQARREHQERQTFDDPAFAPIRPNRATRPATRPQETAAPTKVSLWA